MPEVKEGVFVYNITIYLIHPIQRETHFESHFTLFNVREPIVGEDTIRVMTDEYFEYVFERHNISHFELTPKFAMGREFKHTDDD